MSEKPLKMIIKYGNEFLNKAAVDFDADNNARIIENYNSFVENFLANAKDMDAETANFINENYIDLLAR